MEAIMRSTCLIVVLAGASLCSATIRGGEWAQFRGPGGTAVSSEQGMPTQWGSEKNIAWKVKLDGYGWSCPVVWGDKVFVTTAFSDKQQKPTAGFGGGGPGGFGPGAPGGAGARGGFGGFMQPGQVLPSFMQERLKLTDEQKKRLEALQKDVDRKIDGILSEEQKKQMAEMRRGFGRGPGGFGRGARAPDVTYKWEVYCLNAADGKVIWKQTAAEGKPSISTNPSNTYATETPVTDGERVYAYFGMTGAFCYDFSGKLLWKAELGSYPMAMGNGTGSSPVLDGGRLFIQCDNEEKSFLVALDARTGKELWRTPRTERTGWSTPFVWKNSKRTEIVCVGSPSARSYDPATGKQLWELRGMTGQCKATPAADSDLLFIGTGGGFGGFGRGGPGGGAGGIAGGKPLFAVKAGASGDISLKEGQDSNDGVAWHQPQGGPATPSPVVYDGRLYVLEDRGGLLNCFDARTGEKVYKERIPGARGFTSSPWVYEGKLFCLDDAGTTHVVKAGAEFEVLGKNALHEMCWSSPAVANGSVYLRTVDHLFCIRNPEKGK
jgi:outer membrane protein assembly factor BamB